MEDHLGISYDNVTTGPYADMMSGMRTFSDDEIRLFEKLTDETYDTFVTNIAENRSLSREDVLNLAGGRIWTGRAALKNGLVDELGGLDRAIEIASEKAELDDGSFRIREYPTPQTFWQRMSTQTRILLTRWGILSPKPSLETSLVDATRILSDFVKAHGRIQARMPYTILVK